MAGDVLCLEPMWGSLAVDDRIDVLAELVIWDDKGMRHLMKSVLHRKFFLISGDLPKVFACSFLQARVESVSMGIRLSLDDKSFQLPHTTACMADLLAVTDVCSGIGVMAGGIQTAGGSVVSSNELRERFVDFQKRQGHRNIIQGDIGDPSVMSQIFHSTGSPSMLTAGFSCQPWSKLGDKKKLGDDRAKTLIHALRLAFYMRSHSVLLECVMEAGEDPEVISLIDTWCKLTGYTRHSLQLQLEDFWPSRRKRWWCILLNPTVQGFSIQGLPKQIVPPVVGDIFPQFPAWPLEDESQLELDLYETNKFYEFQSMDNAIIRDNSPLATALHGWGNQLQGCPCGCRKHPMSFDRLKSRGIFGALVVMEGSIESTQGPVIRTRHIHPWELSLLCGADPTKIWNPDLRLSIAGLGQMASPIQSHWIYAHFRFCIGKQFDWIDIPTPEESLWNHVASLFTEFQQSQPSLFSHRQVQKFVDSTHCLLFEKHMDRRVPINPFVTLTSHDRDTEASVVPSSPCEVDGKASDADQIEPISPTIPFTAIDSKIEATDGQKMSYTSSGGVVAFSNKRQLDRDESNEPCKSKPKVEHFTSTNSFAENESDAAFTDPYMQTATQSHADISSDDIDSMTCEALRISLHDQQVKNLHESADETLSQSVGVTNAGSETTFTQEITSNIDECEFLHSLRAISLDANDVAEISIPARPFVIQLVHPGVETPLFVVVPPGTTAGMVAVADGKLESLGEPNRTNDAVGSLVSCSTVVQPFQQLFLQSVKVIETLKREGGVGPTWHLPPENPCTRYKALLGQEAWVALDEMSFYLSLVQEMGLCNCVPPFVHKHCIEEMEQWFSYCLGKLEGSTVLATAIWADHHWLPVVFHLQESQIQIYSTAQGLTLLHQFKSPIMEFECVHVPQIFHADCGFQAINCMIRLVHELGNQVDLESPHPFKCMLPTTAVAWRRLFEHHLLVTGRAKNIIVPNQLILGGMPATIEEQISELLSSHGVPSDAVGERMRLVLDKVGKPKLTHAMRASRPWSEIKAICNAMTPKLQLVLPHELADVIRSRVSQSNKFGDKSKKIGKQAKTANPIVLNPADLTIPRGIFKQGNDQELPQISVQEINSEACGVVLMSIQEANPYLRLPKPISKLGLAILLLEHDHPSCADLGSVLRFPCRFEQTGEPILITARIVQIGNEVVTRNLPQHQTSVEEVETTVIRAVLFRDEISGKWGDIVEKPVRHILQQLGLDSIGAVLDVWDRQFLDHKMAKSSAAKSDIFVASFRIAEVDWKPLMMSSGNQGLYIEPRSPDGRSPSGDYRVTWLPRTDKASAIANVQSSDVPVCLARSGLKYGLRSLTQDAEKVHNSHKSHLPFLDTTSVLKYVAGPFPFGATRSSLQKVFGTWQWNARPVQPKGRSADGTGISWEIHASQAPECLVYSMKHGDIIISEISKPKKAFEHSRQDILASAKTLSMLRSQPAGSVRNPEIDPFVVNDPWATYAPVSKVPRVSTVSQQVVNKSPSMDVVAATIDRKIAEAFSSVHPKPPGLDEEMPSAVDSRVDHLEGRLAQLEQAVSGHHQQQAQHQAQVQQQFKNVQVQIETQQSSLQSHFDQKMSEQLSQIERLINSKKARLE